jgi:hypothetical protein
MREGPSKNQVSQEHPRRSLWRNKKATGIQREVVRLLCTGHQPLVCLLQNLSPVWYILNEKLSLSERVWTCVCGITHDRDVNAAINIKREGDKKMQEEQQRRRSDGLSKLACGATVRPLDQRRVATKQESHAL